MGQPDGVFITQALGAMLSIPQSISGESCDLRIWRAPEGYGTPCIWFGSDDLAWVYLGSRDPRATLSNVISQDWVENLFKEPALAKDLSGVFGFFAVDFQARKAIAVNDRLGVQSVFFSRDGDGRLWASTHLMWLLLTLEHDGKVDELGFLTHMGFGYAVNPDQQVYHGIRKIPPSGYLVAGADEIEQKRYWSQPKTSKPLSTKNKRELVESLSTSVDSKLSSQRASLGLTAGKDSLCLASILKEKKDLLTTTFGMPKCADRLQAKQISSKMGWLHSSTGICPAEDFLTWAFHISFHSAGLATASYVDMTAFVGKQIPLGSTFIIGEGGECVRDFFGKNGQEAMTMLKNRYMTPKHYLIQTLSGDFYDYLDDYPNNLLDQAERLAQQLAEKQLDKDSFIFYFYRFQRMQGNFSLRHAVLSALRPKISPFLDASFIDMGAFQINKNQHETEWRKKEMS